MYFLCSRKFVFRSMYDVYSRKHELSEVDTECSLKKTKLEVDQHVLEKNELENVEKIGLMSSNVYQRKLSQNFIDWLQRTVIK